MNVAAAFRSYSGLQALVWLLVGVSLLLSLAVAFLSYVSTQRDTLVILAPPQLDGPAELRRDAMSHDLQRTWALFFADRLGNVTPANIEAVRVLLEPFFAAAIHAEARQILVAQAADLQRSGITQSFEVRETFHDEVGGRWYVTGMASTRAPGTPEQRGLRTFELSLETRDFRPLLTFVDVYEGPPPVEVRRRPGRR